MKTKKILAICISCLLLIGAMVGFTASAEGGQNDAVVTSTAPAVEIYQTNVSYEGAIRILYTLNTANLAEGQDVKVVFSFDSAVAAPAGVLDAADYDFVGDDIGYIDVGGMNYLAVYSDGFAPADMAKTVYAIPVIVDAEGAVVASGKTVAFSVRDYLMARLNGNCTKEQFLLYMAALDFGGSVQNAQKVTEDKDPAYGYVDAYYVLKVMDGSGEVTTYSYREPTEISLKAPKGYDGKLFDSFVDNKGVKYEDADFNIYNFKLDKIGTTYVKYVYGDTEISMDGVNATAGNDATLTNNDSITVNGGSEFYIESDVTLAAGTSATLAFNPDVATINLSEADGVVTVSDGVSSFTMINGSTLRIEYTVLSTTKLTGVLFYYVNNNYVAKSDITSIANSVFNGITVSAIEGEISLDYATVGATSDIMTVTNASATFEIGEDGEKHLVGSKTSSDSSFGYIAFTYGGDRTAHAVFETKMKLTGTFYSSNWNNYIDIDLQVLLGQYNLANPRIIIQKNSVKVNGVATTLETPIADDGWFDLKIDVVTGSTATIYINDQVVGTVSVHATNKLGCVRFVPSPEGGSSGKVYIKDAKIYTVE